MDIGEEDSQLESDVEFLGDDSDRHDDVHVPGPIHERKRRRLVEEARNTINGMSPNGGQNTSSDNDFVHDVPDEPNNDANDIHHDVQDDIEDHQEFLQNHNGNRICLLFS